MEATAFRDLAIAAIERQIARGTRLVAEEWGASNDTGPLECGCGIALVLQDQCGDAAARSFIDAVYDNERLESPVSWLRKLGPLSLSDCQTIAFIDGFDGRDRAAHEPAQWPWFDAGELVAEHFSDVLEVENGDDPADYDDSMDGDHASALESAYGLENE